MALHLVLSNTARIPIYEQIKQQIKAAILSGEVSEGDALPSIRVLARDLRVSVITTTRAYSDLAAEEFVTNVPGKGSYVLPRDRELIREQIAAEIEELFTQAIRKASMAGISVADLHAALDALTDDRKEP